MAKSRRRKNKLVRVWHRFAYKHTLTAIITISIFVLLLDTAIVQGLLNDITSLQYTGMVLTGALFVSFFTAAPAVVLLLAFADIYSLLVVAAVAAAGAMIGDYLILRFAEDKIGHELKPIARRLKLMNFINLLHKKRFKPVTAFFGAVIIASPFPDEAGVALLGLSHISTIKLLALAYCLNAAGILTLLLAFG